MTLETLATESRFFKIAGGDTVLESRPLGWIRWDSFDGPVGTSMWTLDSPGIEEITEAEAQVLILAVR